ncbi:maltose operon periplasmic protein MalM [Vibrio sp. RC586]|uniref:MalM family protein n=2 Tax=Gammaproteobacteria TaxID=1236 RepID=UPI0001BB8110|nr:MalM family protein [Vibrio sp. RC586]EEY99902.1 maltose operon periplasmic protein MalM [Vibrio sp. RC586]
MVLRALLLGGCIALAGCQSTAVVEQVKPNTGQEVQQIGQLQATKVKLPSTTKVALTKETQYLRNQVIASPVALFEIPADRGQMTLTITSEIGDSVFYPHVMIVDAKGQVVESYEDTVFEYRKPRLNLGNRLVAELAFYPPQGYKSLFVLVYTQEQDLQAVTYVAHPARIDAEARGNYLPEVKDIPVSHALTGTIELDVSGPSFLSFVSSEDRQAATSSDADAAKTSLKVQPDTQTYYFTAIERAVEVNDLPKALSLLDEAKALGVEGVQEVFVKAVNARK